MPKVTVKLAHKAPDEEPERVLEDGLIEGCTGGALCVRIPASYARARDYRLRIFYAPGTWLGAVEES